MAALLLKRGETLGNLIELSAASLGEAAATRRGLLDVLKLLEALERLADDGARGLAEVAGACLLGWKKKVCVCVCVRNV